MFTLTRWRKRLDYFSPSLYVRIDKGKVKMRPITHKNHQITVYPKWNPDTRLWACDATVCSIEEGHSKKIPMLDSVRRHQFKSTAVTAILNTVRSWIDHGKPERFPIQ